MVEPNTAFLRKHKDNFILTDKLFDLNEIKREVLKVKPDVVILDYIGLVNIKGCNEKDLYQRYADEVKQFVQKHQWMSWIDLSNLNKTDDEETIRIHKGFNGAAKLRNNTDVAIHMFDHSPFSDYKKLSFESGDDDKISPLRGKKAVTFLITKNRLGSDGEEQVYSIDFNKGIKYIEATEKQKEIWSTLV